MAASKLKTIFLPLMLLAFAATAFTLAATSIASAQGVPAFPSQVSGTVTQGGTPVNGGTVSFYVGGTQCGFGSGANGTVSSTGTYSTVVTCSAGTVTVYYNGVATSFTFTLSPGSQYANQAVTVTGASTAATATPTQSFTPSATNTPFPTSTPRPATSTPVPAVATNTPERGPIPLPPNTGSPSQGESATPWFLIVMGMLAAGGATALVLSGKRASR